VKMQARSVFFVALLLAGALAGCAQVQPATTAAVPVAKPAKPANEVLDFTIPPDALGAHDPQLTSILMKAGSLAAAQKKPTTIRVVALTQDFQYLNQAIWRGVPPRRIADITLENQTAGMGQPYGVSIKTAP
jgi:type IV pilus biogenesis protein CpaD/CtpE